MPAHRRSPTGTIASALRPLLGLVAVFAALALLGSCAGERPSLGSIPPSSSSTPTAETTLEGTTTTVQVPVDDGTLGPDDLRGWITTPIGTPKVYDRPADDATDLEVPATTKIGAPMTFAIVGDAAAGAVLPQPGWYRVALHSKPNGSTGWVRTTDVTTPVRTLFKIYIDLDERTLRVEEDLEQVFETDVAIGSTEDPTPRNGTYITELIDNDDPEGAYGPYAFGLAMHSPTAENFGGGEGQVGIHGTNRPELIGQEVSHGCIRLENEQIEALVDLQLPLGVPVFIA